MELKTIQEKENKLFNRKEIQASIESEITPSNSDIEKLISEKFSTQIENIKIKKISGKFGSKTFTVLANIYASKEDKDKIEQKKDKGKKEIPAQEQAENKEEEKKEEAEKQELAKPDEEPTQENKVEEKTE